MQTDPDILRRLDAKPETDLATAYTTGIKMIQSGKARLFVLKDVQSGKVFEVNRHTPAMTVTGATNRVKVIYLL